MTETIARVLVDVSGNLLQVEQDRLVTSAYVTSSVLPSGAATEATLNSINGKDFATETTQATLLTETQFTSSIDEVSASLGIISGSIASRLNILGQSDMSGSTPVVIANDQSPVNINITDDQGNDLSVEDNILVPSGTNGILSMGVDYNDVAHRLRTTDDGRLVTNSAVAAPPNRIAVNEGTDSIVNGTVDENYIIPTGESLFIQRFAGGAETESNQGSKCVLYYAPDGVGTPGTWQLIRVGYVNGNNFEFTLDYEIPDVGNGTRSVVCRRERLSGGGKYVAAFWDGYY